MKKHYPSPDAVAALCKRGLSRIQIAERLGTTYFQVCSVITRHGLRPVRHKIVRKRSPALIKRDAAIVKQLKAGEHVVAVAKRYGITVSRVFHIAEIGGIKRQDIVRSVSTRSTRRVLRA